VNWRFSLAANSRAHFYSGEKGSVAELANGTLTFRRDAGTEGIEVVASDVRIVRTGLVTVFSPCKINVTSVAGRDCGDLRSGDAYRRGEGDLLGDTGGDRACGAHFHLAERPHWSSIPCAQGLRFGQRSDQLRPLSQVRVACWTGRGGCHGGKQVFDVAPKRGKSLASLTESPTVARRT
jgi:hypothetical protein